MALFEQNDIEEVRSRTDLVQVVGAHVRLKRAGRNFIGLCPFHNEKTPSFTLNAERGFFHCFGCGAGGSVFDFVMRMEGLTFPEAMESLAKGCGITLPERTASNGTASGAARSEREGFLNANKLAAEFYSHVLWNTTDGELAREYLKSRGITATTAEAFMIGFAPNRPANLVSVLQKRGLLEPAAKLGLARRDDGGSYHDMFRARLIFPIRDPQGHVIGFGGRVLDSRLPKYINSAESPVYSKARALYGLHEARQAIGKADRAIVVEGYIDVVALWQAGFRETVASLGTALTPEQLRLLSRYTQNIVACFDGDNAGRKASLRALEVFLQAGLLGRGAFLPDGYDPDTLVQQRGAEHFKELLGGAELLIEMFLREQASLAPKGRADSDQRARALTAITDKLRLIKDEFQFNLLVRKAVDLVGFTDREEAALRREARRAGRTAQPSRNAAPRAPLDQPRVAALDAVAQAELGLVGLVLHHPDLRQELKTELKSRLCTSPTSPIVSLMEEICATGDSIETNAFESAIIARLDQQQRAWLSATIVRADADDPARARLLMEDYLKALAARQRRREVADSLHMAQTAHGDEATAAAQALIVARRRATD